jgi:hypothetical protein
VEKGLENYLFTKLNFLFINLKSADLKFSHKENASSLSYFSNGKFIFQKKIDINHRYRPGTGLNLFCNNYKLLHFRQGKRKSPADGFCLNSFSAGTIHFPAEISCFTGFLSAHFIEQKLIYY